MKKIALLLVLALLIGCLAGCATKKPNNEIASTTGNSSETPDIDVDENPDGIPVETVEGSNAEDPHNITPESIPIPGEFDGALDEKQCSAEEHVMVSTVNSEADCENYGEILHMCSICGWSRVEMVEPTGHDYSAPSCEFDAYCNNCQAIIEPATGHTTTNGICENCGTFVDGQNAPLVEDQADTSEEEING